MYGSKYSLLPTSSDIENEYGEKVYLNLKELGSLILTTTYGNEGVRKYLITGKSISKVAKENDWTKSKVNQNIYTVTARMHKDFEKYDISNLEKASDSELDSLLRLVKHLKRMNKMIDNNSCLSKLTGCNLNVDKPTISDSSRKLYDISLLKEQIEILYQISDIHKKKLINNLNQDFLFRLNFVLENGCENISDKTIVTMIEAKFSKQILENILGEDFANKIKNIE